MTDVTLVSMNAEHVSEVLDIERNVFSTPWTADMFRQEIRSILVSRSIVALERNRVIGYRIAWFLDTEVHLVNIAVASPYQGQGIGSMLLDQLVDTSIAEGKKLITLEVRESNRRAQSFYRRFMFRTVGIRKGYYSDNREDALLMTLDLENLVRRKVIGGERYRTG